MINELSRATSYLQTFYLDHTKNRWALRSHATGFFIRTEESIFLVTNWHVVSGIDPASPKSAQGGTPYYIKSTIYGREGALTELTIPLYDRDMKPLWYEHPDGMDVDLVALKLPLQLEKYYHFYDIARVLNHDHNIAEHVGRDAFIIGYPFNRVEMLATFGDDAAYYLPVWKRGSIASKPALRLGGRVLLIGSLSRPGMSGSPVVIAEEVDEIGTNSRKNADALKELVAGRNALDAVLKLDTDDLVPRRVKKYQLLGIYSGTIGTTRLAEVALGQCWHIDVIKQLFDDARPGTVPNAPTEHDLYNALLDEMSGQLIIIDYEGNRKHAEDLA
ncbi:trypsin-like peptidase domain-containing protein [Brucella pituitosa]|uniref:trypsin-like peptidase domain-containing protein n=1 Tax=Brucella pituitosa TaxID=571256 RepID=UPI0009A20812|nr:trypsin-like peptidase domain-containing protein [Brucella pituitosa]